MAFGRPADEEQLSYGGYLELPELLSLQQLRSEPPEHDEMLFIAIHQTYELWFKQLLHELDAVVAHLGNDEPLAAHRLLGRCVEIERVIIEQVTVLETMTPMDFLAFRDRLKPASGFQSAQFREIEALSGLDVERFLDNYKPGSAERARIEARVREPSLGDAFYNLLRRRGFTLPDAEAVEDDNGTRESKVHATRMRELARLYREPERYETLYLLAERMIEYDELFTRWRLRHITMVERMIGGKMGTGGSEGAAYLRTTLGRKFFPDLWALRTHLSEPDPANP